MLRISVAAFWAAVDLFSLKKGHLGFVSSFHSRGWIYFQSYKTALTIHGSIFFSLRATTTVHCGWGKTYLPYHKLPYSPLTGAIDSNHWTNLKGLHTVLVYKQQQRFQQLTYNIRIFQLSHQQYWCIKCTVKQCVVFCHVCVGLPCVLYCIGGGFQGPHRALGLVPPWKFPVSLLSQCQSHWLTWILFTLFYCFILIYAYKHMWCIS